MGCHEVSADESFVAGMKEGGMSERVRIGTGARVRHPVRCPYCANEFDLFAACWCEHQQGEASKVCPSCRRCVCQHPAYLEPLFWKDAPAGFQQQGFRRLFLFYL